MVPGSAVMGDSTWCNEAASNVIIFCHQISLCLYICSHQAPHNTKVQSQLGIEFVNCGEDVQQNSTHCVIMQVGWSFPPQMHGSGKLFIWHIYTRHQVSAFCHKTKRAISTNNNSQSDQGGSLVRHGKCLRFWESHRFLVHPVSHSQIQNRHTSIGVGVSGFLHGAASEVAFLP